ncbi:MAG: hypothetical protein KC475_04130 [Cyanobacteria bacterium HKST-UBA03]|nr:hypothetical protein [Cyanobacteria bacterium HKST-UBA03]
MINFSINENIDIVALYAAFTATVALFWNIWNKINDRPRIIIKVRPGYKIVGNPLFEEIHQGKVYMIVDVTNRGTQSTTIKNLGMHIYKSRINAFFKIKPRLFAIPLTQLDPTRTKELPQTIKPGEHWTGHVLQNNLEKEIPKNGISRVYIVHSFSDKPVEKTFKL